MGLFRLSQKVKCQIQWETIGHTHDKGIGGIVVTELSFGYSPCPNDTFMFNAIAAGTIKIPDYRISPVLHDVETLNDMALACTLDITKLSFYAWLTVREKYGLLGSGAAMGFGCGPVAVSKEPVDPSRIDRCRIVLPGRWTTAHLLFQMWAPNAKDRIFVSYDRIFDTLAAGRADVGVIIHESRFTFESAGFQQVVDLGAWWEERTGLPIPLGGIAAKKSLGQELVGRIETAIEQSIRRAMDDPKETMPYIRQHAQEMDGTVIETHIQTFVNDFSLSLPDEGKEAIRTLEAMARAAGAI